MNTQIYLFFSFFSVCLFFVSIWDWSNTKSQTIAGFPMLLSGILSLLLFASSWSVEYASGGVVLPALTDWEAYAVAVIWFLMFVISVLLTIVIYFDKVKEMV